MSKQKRGVQYVQQDEPAFLKRMKQQAGFKEGPTVDTKRQELARERDADSDTEHEDEKPQVVLLKSGDLTEEQAKNVEKESAMKPREATNEKIVFKKPTKNANNTEPKDNNSKKEKKKSTAKKIKNASLLSFGDEEDS